MNILEAKKEIKNTITLYLDKDENGHYRVPVVRQRPIFLLGAPGIGKTAIMEQIAEEMDIALISYSMTHHTRQSAIGLPYLADREFEGKQYTVSEYTMSEIIASIYEVMKTSGKREGILFLDEINCVSETLAPSMLLFLQYKRFGNEQVPEGWVIVTAGNPPQYNKSVKEFDVATMDRLKYLVVEENLSVWKQYAMTVGIHPAIMAFLETKPDAFYQVQASVQGNQYVTARGWEDLSTMLRGYERLNFEVTASLILQYITVPDIARDFKVYYELFNKYKKQYLIQDILNGSMAKDMIKNASKAQFDERLALVANINDAICAVLRDCIREEMVLQKLAEVLRKVKTGVNDKNVINKINENRNTLLELFQQRRVSGNLGRDEQWVFESVDSCLDAYVTQCSQKENRKFDGIKKTFGNRVDKHEKCVQNASEKLKNGFEFIRACWGEEYEMVLYTGGLTMNKYASRFIAQWGSPDYYKYNRELLVYDRDVVLKKEIQKLFERE